MVRDISIITIAIYLELLGILVGIYHQERSEPVWLSFSVFLTHSLISILRRFKVSEVRNLHTKFVIVRFFKDFFSIEITL